jgi:chromosome segregation ATPase
VESNNPSFIALLSTVSAVGGGIALKGVEYLIARGTRSADELKEFRIEQRDEIKALKAEIADLHKEIDAWQDKYYTLKGSHERATLRITDLERHVAHTEAETMRLREIIQRLTPAADRLPDFLERRREDKSVRVERREPSDTFPAIKIEHPEEPDDEQEGQENRDLD